MAFGLPRGPAPQSKQKLTDESVGFAVPLFQYTTIRGHPCGSAAARAGTGSIWVSGSSQR